MNLGKASFFLLAVAVLAEARPGGTRGLLNEDHWDTNSWSENYGYCNGAVGGKCILLQSMICLFSY